MAGKQTITEFKSDDMQSEIPDPITPGDPHANRRADQDNGQKAIPQFATKTEAMNAVVSAMAGISQAEISDFLAGLDKSKNKRPLDKDTKIVPKSNLKMAAEDMELVFGDAELSEELKERTATVFEAAVNTRATLVEQELTEEFETRLTEAVAEIRSEISEDVNTYLSYVAEEWLKENQVAAQSNLRVQAADNFMNALRDLMVEHAIVLPESVDIVEDLTARLDEANARIAELVQTVSKLQEEIEAHEISEAFIEATDGLTMTQIEKLRTLAEGIDFDSVDEYGNKLQTLKESIFSEKKSTPAKSDLLTEESIDEDANAKPPVTNAAVSGYVAHIRRQTS